MWSAITCLCFEITEKVGIGCIWWITPWVSWRHCCADFIAVLTRGKNDLALYFHLTRQRLKYHSSFGLLINNWKPVGMIWAQFCFPWQVQFSDFWLWLLASFVPTNSSSVHFAFVTFSALLFAFIYGFCLTFKKKLCKQTCTEMGDILRSAWVPPE